MQLIRNKAQQ